MWRRKPERLLEGMVRENRLAEQEADGMSQPPRARLFALGQKAARVTAEQTAKRRDRRSDLTLAALGVTLGLICALFPWYIFFNPEEFGVRAMKFGGSGGGTEPIVLGAQSERIGAPVAAQDVPAMRLDLLSTGTSTQDDEEDQQHSTVHSFFGARGENRAQPITPPSPSAWTASTSGCRRATWRHRLRPALPHPRLLPWRG